MNDVPNERGSKTNWLMPLLWVGSMIGIVLWVRQPKSAPPPPEIVLRFNAGSLQLTAVENRSSVPTARLMAALRRTFWDDGFVDGAQTALRIVNDQMARVGDGRLNVTNLNADLMQQLTARLQGGPPTNWTPPALVLEDNERKSR
jgi:hypothetical protein